VSHAVETTNLLIAFGDQPAVNDVSLHVDYGEIVTLLGPNGAGKTTLVETLLGFRSPQGGSARVHGLDPVAKHRDVVARTGALLQRGGVWFPMTPRQVLQLTATYYPEARDPDELIDTLALRDCASTPWRRLSGGEQQRTLLALALLGRPKVLLLDEPTTAVDPEGRQVIRALLSAERDRGCALLITTHELVEAERSADRVIILNRGEVLAEGSVAELAGAAVLIIETSDAVSADELAGQLGAPVVATDARTLTCSTASSPEVLASINAFLHDRGVVMTAMRTRASLEERYLELIRQEAS
jgi:ABC-2 type transport system ATP-binding protein